MSENDGKIYPPSNKRGYTSTKVSPVGSTQNSGFRSLSSSPSSPIYLYENGRRHSGSSHVSSSFYGNSSIEPINSSSRQGSAGNISKSSCSSVNGYGMSAYNAPATSFPLHSTSNQRSIYSSSKGKVVFQTNGEILSLAKSNATPNLFAISGQKSLQLVRISETEIALEYDLVTQPGHRRNTKFGLISDLKFGHHAYGRHIAASTLSGSIYLYNLDRGNRIQSTLNEHQRAVNSIDFSTTAPYRLVSGSQDGKMKIWDIRMRNARAATTISGNWDAVRCVQFNPRHENTICCITDSGVIQKWDIRNPSTFERRLNAHSGPGLTLDFHPELDYIVTGGRDKQLEIWSMGSGSEYSREPDHVIYTSGPIYKVCWCRGRGNGSIMNTDIATCFLNDDPCVQIWSLSRKYIPKHTVEYHTNQITGLLWKSPRYLVTCSKDKTLIQHDIFKEPNVIDNYPSGAISWNPNGANDFIFVKQDKNDFNTFKEPSKVSSLFKSTAPELPNSVVHKSRTSSASVDILQHPLQSSVSLASYINSGTEKNIKRIPPISRKSSSFYAHSQNYAAISPITVPIDLALPQNDPEVFTFLSAKYQISIPKGKDLAQICEENAKVASLAGKPRDYQVWRAIRFSIIYQMSQEHENKDNTSKKDGSGPYSGTTNKESTLSVQSTLFQNGNSTESYQSSFKSSEESHRLNSSTDDQSKLEEPKKAKSIYPDSGRRSSQRKKERLHFTNNDVRSKEADKYENAIADEEEDVSTSPAAFTGDVIAQPMTIKKSDNRTFGSFKNRYSFTGSSVDFDNERVLSPSSSVGTTKSAILPRVPVFSSLNSSEEEGKILKSILSRKTSANTLRRNVSTGEPSQLTEILKHGVSTFTEHRAQFNLKNDQHGNTNLQVPWYPSDLIKQAAEFSAKQGDVLLCATFALLFRSAYPDSITSRQAEEWILSYHKALLRHCLFSCAAAVVKKAADSYESFKTIGQTKTSVRLYCNNCHSLIANEVSKKRLQEGDENVEFGFWYCDKCSKRQGNCAYCEEPLKGLCMALLGCGHKGHFKCFRAWFIDENQSSCPSCGTPVVQYEKQVVM
ncbi:hypothetical protein BRETT_004220 [Brettanomyces bruxellensis]|uniref:Restriction of telomere capping protein 1 n=1 Tax=Dekkera bruxellensis TaxID=5007 RepID=A0A871R0H1_DEKBR|nr:uncharacterized protein BRETT_004220 [Brettanomyces bruxellensis]QOU18999.1 hypothetical protein BRETT_004220 [Brettanomyces bruxellensis]